jgi:hypothetical protein
LTKEILAEDYKGEPNHEAEVESDKLTATLSENDKVEDIKDLEKLLKNPDPSRAKDYGSIEKYKKMLKAKIDRLKKTNESGDPTREHPDVELVKWLEKRLDKSLPSDEYQRDRLEKLLAKLKTDLKKDLKNESGDPFRDIVKKYASLYRDSELSRREKEDYFKWLQTNQPEKFKKVVGKLKKK